MDRLVSYSKYNMVLSMVREYETTSNYDQKLKYLFLKKTNKNRSLL